MRKLLAAILALLSFGAAAGTAIETPAFKLMLGDGWTRGQSTDAEQQTYYSAKEDVGLTTSFMLVNAQPKDTERMANKLRDFRLKAEDTAAAQYGLKMTIVEPIVTPYGDGYQIAYYGHDSNNRQFRYLGVVMPKKIINIYAESKGRSQQELEVAFNGLLKGLSIPK